jgi:type IV secretory pathway VirB3-like protein
VWKGCKNIRVHTTTWYNDGQSIGGACAVVVGAEKELAQIDVEMAAWLPSIVVFIFIVFDIESQLLMLVCCTCIVFMILRHICSNEERIRLATRVRTTMGSRDADYARPHGSGSEASIKQSV